MTFSKQGPHWTSDGRASQDVRALPDGEIARGTPIPAVVPIPMLPMAPIPAPVKIVSVNDPKSPAELSGYRAVPIDPNDQKNPGYPFFIPGVGGRRVAASAAGFRRRQWRDTRWRPAPTHRGGR